MMRLFRIVKRNMRRTPYQALAASMVMFLTFLTLLLFLLLAAGSQKILQYYESKPQAIAFFKDNTQDSDIIAIQNSLQQTGKVVSLKYVSKDEALEIYKDRNKNNPTLLELVTANILPASLEISTTSLSDLEPVAEVLKKEPVVEEVVVPEDVIDYLNRATMVVRWVGGASVLFLLIFAVLVILMITGFKIRIKRTEIEIMKLLGASAWFIRAPFLLEGISYGLIGAIPAWIFSYALIWYFTPFIENNIKEVPLVPASPLFMLALLGVVILVATIIGAIGSYGAVRRYLRL